MKSNIFLVALFIIGIQYGACQWNELMESSDNFEGDIELNATQHALLHGNNAFGLTKKGVSTRWPTNVPIPFVISDDHKKHKYRVDRLKRAMKDYEAKTCLRFKERTNERAYINFGTGNGCSSPIGMQYAGNFIRLAGGCFSHGTLLHEIAHTLGIWHEQNRPDRDQYIKVRPENMACCSSQFRKMTTAYIDSLGFPYDLDSMMHYGKYAFGNGKGPTIEPLDKFKRIGQRNGFSEIDIKQINAMYCNGAPGTPSPTTKGPLTTRKVTTKRSTPSLKRGKVFRQASSNMCLDVDQHTNRLVFSSRCQTRFMVSEGRLWKVGDRYMKCAAPTGTKSESAITFRLNCNESFSKVTAGSAQRFFIKHNGTGKCIHPRGGSSQPKEGTEAVIFHICNGGARIQFVEV